MTNTSTGKLNLVHAGDLIQLKFGLARQPGPERARRRAELGRDPVPGVDAALGAGGAGGLDGGLSYNAANNQYRFGWQTTRPGPARAAGSRCR